MARSQQATRVLVALMTLALLATGCGSRRAGNPPQATGAARAATKAQLADNQNALDREAGTLATDSFNLHGELATLEGAIPDGGEALRRERLDLQRAQHALRLTSSAGAARICADASATQRAAARVQGDIAAQHQAEDTFVGDAQSVLFAAGQLKADNDQFRHDLAVVRNYVPAGAPAVAAVTAALASARTAVTRGRSTLATDLRAAGNLAAQANGYAKQAHAACAERGQ